ncbi:MAG: translation initiation factor IF-2 [Polyangiaceae bacterium]
MSKVRVYEVAKQLNLEPKAVVALFQTLGVTDVRNHMSSVDPDQVDRIKRHLEKQKTHDLVEERIRPTVVKRRAIAKAPDAAPSKPEVAPPADVVSGRALPAIEEEATEVREKARESKPAPVRRVSTRDLAAVSAPEPAEAPAATIEIPRRSTRTLPEDVPSARALPTPEPSAPRIPTPAPSVKEVAPPAPAPTFAEEMAAAKPEELIPPPEDVLPEPTTTVSSAAPQAVEAAPEPEPVQPVTRSVAPKTGVEYWTGRPGVPMPTPQGVSRTGIGGGTTGAMPRRVQYDPRSGSSGPARPGMRPGAPMMGRGPMRPGGQFGRRPPFGTPVGPRTRGPSTTKEMSDHKKVIRIEENITLQAMAQRMSLKATELLMKLIGMGMTGIHINTSLDADTAKILASEFGWEVEDVAVSEEANIAMARGEEETTTLEEGVEIRSPVVTVMGHVDHGKTSLLDRIRKAKVAAGEAGGITQHIGAYKVPTGQGTVVFLDTPGHEAFTAMRARGAGVTDIVVLVVAADDGVMPQTKEAVAHAKAAKVPIIVAVNKIDKPTAEPDRVRRELVELGLQPEDWGGDTIYVNVSAVTGEGIDSLLEMISLQAEVLDLRATPKKPASGTVLEALLDRGRGPVARILVQDGTLRVGDFVLAGAGFGKVRAMTNEHGKAVHEAGPATPVEILGLSDVPGAGDPLHAVKDPKKAQEIAESRRSRAQKSLIPATAKVSLEELSKRVSDSGQLELRVIVKGDVQGSVEAVGDALSKLSGEKVRLLVVHAGVGAITEGDVNLAIAARAIIIGFNVRPAGKAGALAEENKIEIRMYSIIYQAVDDVKSAMEGLLPANLVEKLLGKAEVRQLFRIKNATIAGSYVTQGMIRRNAIVRVVRDGNVVHDGKISALKRFKDDVKDVAEGFECGISVEGFNDLKELDMLECFEMEEVKQKL